MGELTPSSGAVFEIRTDAKPGDAEYDHAGEVLLWASPGSHRLGEVEAAWTERGWQGLASLPGPWAVALTEEASRSVVVAHDAMGAMPLFWASTVQGGILISSHLPSLADDPRVDARLAPERVALRHYPGSGGLAALSTTDFRNIDAVPFGHGLVIAPDGTVAQRRFWHPEVSPAPSARMPAVQCTSAVAAGLENALQRMFSDLAGTTVAMKSTDSTIARRAYDGLVAAGAHVTAIYVHNAIAPPGASSTHAGGSAAEGARAPAPLWRHLGPTVQSRQHLRQLDHHRYPNRGMEALAVELPDAVAAGASVIISFEGLRVFHGGALPIATGQLARGEFSAFRRTLGVVPPARRRLFLRMAVAGAYPRAASTVQGARTAMSRRAESAKAVRFPIPAAAAREQSRRYAVAQSASEFAVAQFLSIEPWRRMEALTSLAGALGLEVYAPFLDPSLMELVLRLPNHAWVHDGQDAWALEQVEDHWAAESLIAACPPPIRMDASVSLAARSALPPRVWCEADPEVADVLRAIDVGRVIVDEPFVDPAAWAQSE